MNIIVFEDSNTNNLKPFSINHASFELKCGLYSNLERIINVFNNDDINFYLIVRNELKEIIQEKFPRYTVNPINIPEGLYLNGAVIWNNELINQVMKDISFSSLGNLISFKNNKINFDDFENIIEKKSKVTTEIDSSYISYLWDCIDLFKSMIKFDKIDFLKLECISSFRNDINIVNIDNIFVDKSAIIEAGCILDGSKGPIILGKNVIIESGSILKGPLFIDNNSIVSNGSKLKGNNLIGPHCKVGGELTNTIFHGYSNKVHDGFLGDSYIGEWVNLGANTNNSNLKNNYGHIKFNFSNRFINTKRTFLGVMIGDFTRTGISTMINTGSYFGLGCNIFGGGFQEKYIKSFSWGRDSIVEFDKLITTIKIMKDRRSKKLSDSEINFLEKIYQKIKK